MLAQQVGISHEALERYLDYAAVFLANIGNYYVRVHRSTFYRPCQWRNREGATENLRQLYRQKTWRRYHTYPSTPKICTRYLINASSLNPHSTWAFQATLHKVHIIRATIALTKVRSKRLTRSWRKMGFIRKTQECRNNAVVIELFSE